MHISLDNLSKRYGYQWIIRSMNLEIESGFRLGVKGHNGSGKSTLLNMISGMLASSEGQIIYRIGDKIISRSEIYRHLTFVAPYINIVDNYSLVEMYDLQSRFKPMRIGSLDEFVALTKLGKQEGKYIKDFSSGMRQRVQLALAILADSPLLMLDEPTSYLDSDAKEWYHNLLKDHMAERTIIIASNDAGDLQETQRIIDVEDFV